MRASRLVSIVLILQSRRTCTADELAAELEVSARTIYRDLEELAVAGVPVYATRGPGGGYKLVGGYQTRLTGLTDDEAESLLLVDTSAPLEALGLGPAVLAARLKVMAALPEAVRDRARTVAGWVHLDLPGWFDEPPSLPACLPTLAEAVLRQRPVSFAYRQPETAERRTVEPLGLVLKGRSWYLVAMREGRLLTYAAWRIEAAELSEGSVTRPEAFDLAATWAQLVNEFEQSLPSVRVQVRATGDARRRLRRVVDTRSVGVTDWVGTPVGNGWHELTVVFERLEYARHNLLALGSDVEVLAPVELREGVAAEVRAMIKIYGDVS